MTLSQTFGILACATLIAGNALALEVENDGKSPKAAGCVIATEKGIVFSFDVTHNKLQLPVGFVQRLEETAQTAQNEARSEVSLSDVTVGKLLRAKRGVYLHECTLNNEEQVLADLVANERNDPPGPLKGIRSVKIDDHISMVVIDPRDMTDAAGTQTNLDFQYKDDVPLLRQYYTEKFGPK
jgi:hypothetical protein